MRKELRLLSILGVALALPLVPLIVGAWAFEERFATWLDLDLPRPTVAYLVFGLLAIDMLLPVPSSMVSTFAGARLGWWQGTLVSWMGMTFGAVVTYGLVRALGVPIVRRLTSQRDLDELRSVGNRWGAVLVVVCRALPVLAEASVVLAGLQRVPARTFLTAIGLSNLVIALFYGLLGEWANEREWLGMAIVASGALPLLLSIAVRRRRNRGLARRAAIEPRANEESTKGAPENTGST